MVDYHLLHELSPVITGWTICVYLHRVYKKIVNPNSYDICCILVDESGEQMEATIDRRFAAVYVETMKEKQWKTISTFTVRKISERIRPTTNPYGIRFMDNTIVTRAEPKQTILFKNLTPFDYIVEKSVPYNILVEIVGAIVEVGGLRNTSANMVDVNGYAITFKIMDRYKVLLTCEALGQTAIDFEENYRQYGRPNMIVALGWWRVVRPYWRSKNVMIVSHGSISKVFPEPEIEEVEEIKMVID